MWTLKYYTAIDEAQRKSQQKRPAVLSAFEVDDLGADSLRRRLILWVTSWLLPLVLAFFRAIWPISRFGRLIIITLDEDVRKVLSRPDVFEVPYGREMAELAGGTNFVLGMEGAGHDRQNRIIRSVLKPEDASHVTELSRQYTLALMRMSGGRIDAMKDLTTRVATDTCIDYFGLNVDDPNAFAEWAMSISAVLFADPFGDPAVRNLSLNGSARIRATIDRSMVNPYRSPDTVLGRLLTLQSSDPSLTDGDIRAIMVGLVTGLIPTNTLAAGKILQELLRRPEIMRNAMETARRAVAVEDENRRTGNAENSDKEALQAILLEAARLNPALAPGQWRYAREEAVIAQGTARERKILKDSVLLVSTMSALRDACAVDAPSSFKADRKPSATDLMFGDGPHWCLGKYVAMAQITEIFMILLAQPGLRTCNDTWGRRIRWVGPFPSRLDMEFEPAVAPAGQTMMTICAPLVPVDKRTAVENQIVRLGNPAELPMRKMLDETGIVHFASLSVIELGDATRPAPHYLLELSVDGPKEAALAKIVDNDATSERHLASIFTNTPMGETALLDILNTYALDLKTRPWGDIGLNFNGTPEFCVANIDMQRALAAFAKDVLDYFQTFHMGFGNRAMDALKFVRGFIRNRTRLENAAQAMEGEDQRKLRQLLARGEKFAGSLIVPSRQRLAISDWHEPTKSQAVRTIVRKSWRLFIPIIALAFVLGVAIFYAASGQAILGLAGRLLLAGLGGAAAALIFVGIIVVGFLILLRLHESRDVPDDQNPSTSLIRDIARVEDPVGYAHNHFMSVTALKTGWFRKLTLAMSLWGIKQLVQILYRPGFVLDMGTIHYAKWFRPSGYDKLLFQSNYDGSWQSYLEDFIMKAHQGQTAAWSNGVGFPLTRFLILDGAQDGDRFKRWVRRQQVIAQFWYSRFPQLTTDQIRANALIHDGLARASTDSEARTWLDCFGTLPRPDNAIETDEVQSLVFRGFVTLPNVIYALVELPEAKDCGDWLAKLVSGIVRGGHGIGELPKNDFCRITFGDYPFSADPELRSEATFVGFTARGIAKLMRSDPNNPDGLSSFQAVFNVGMANRARVLGDFEDSAPERWRWLDSDLGGVAGQATAVIKVDAVLLIYGQSIDQCRKILTAHQKSLGSRARFHLIETRPAAKGIDYEHFGFRDGISQPVIRGTQRFSKGSPTRDIVEPGEFILGYRNNQHYYPPAVTVGADSDRRGRLPTVLKTNPTRFPSFDDESATRDFGRNGSFLVIRQLTQDVEGFKRFTEVRAEQLRMYDNFEEIAGAPIDSQWVAAKLMGRWQDGTPLVVQPAATAAQSPPKHPARYNDFSYGTDDPQGLHCPFGAHIRRANPRDSLDPDDSEQQAVTNRHRLLRRGRSYDFESAGDENESKGLLFTCICADLERQFEFIQQTWIRSPDFHGLQNEPDPMVSSRDLRTRVFTIPTPSGPLRLHDMESFVTVRGGGYFFLPSRSAIQYLADLIA